MEAIEHLGDGLYVTVEGGMIKLMANDPHSPTDTVYLEGQVWESLQTWVERRKQVQAALRASIVEMEDDPPTNGDVAAPD